MFLNVISLITEEGARNGVRVSKLGWAVSPMIILRPGERWGFPGLPCWLPPQEGFHSVWNLPRSHTSGWFSFHSSYGDSCNCTQTRWLHSRWEVGFHNRPRVLSDCTEMPGDSVLREDRVSCIFCEWGWVWEGSGRVGWQSYFSQSAAALQSIVLIISSINNHNCAEVEVIHTNSCHMDKLFVLATHKAIQKKLQQSDFISGTKTRIDEWSP